MILPCLTTRETATEQSPAEKIPLFLRFAGPRTSPPRRDSNDRHCHPVLTVPPPVRADIADLTSSCSNRRLAIRTMCDRCEWRTERHF
jgi:hypothetical protein